jgi:ADP-ribose pyrophosphatase YjhB (NUDIX family)
MPVSEYVRELRAAVGHRRLILVGAAGVVQDKSGRLVLIQRSDTEEWALPAGIMEPGESVIETVVREVQEETGLEVEPVRLVGLYTDPAEMNVTYPNGDQIQVVSVVFECRLRGGSLRADDDEVLDTAFFTLDALPATLHPGHRRRILDAMTKHPEAYYT